MDKSRTPGQDRQDCETFRVNKRSQVRPLKYNRHIKKAKAPQEINIDEKEEICVNEQISGSSYKGSVESTLIPVDDSESIEVSEIDLTGGPQSTRINDCKTVNPENKVINEPESEFINEPICELVIDHESELINEPESGFINEPICELIIDPESELINDPESESVNVAESESVNDTENESINDPENDLIDHIKQQESTLIENLLEDLAKQNNWEVTEEEISDDEEDDDLPDMQEDSPVQPGSTIALKTSILLVWLFAMAHSITSSQFKDLLTLINLHLVMTNPVFKSLYKFKSFFSHVTLSAEKFYFCSYCTAVATPNQNKCSYHLCEKDLNCKNGKSHFISLDIKTQLESFYKRKDFRDGLKHRFNRTKKKKDNIEDIYDGELYQKLCLDHGPLCNENNITFTFNTDGVPIFKSSNTSAWPIFLVINELPYKMRSSREFMLLAGLWCGSAKPVMNMFLNPLSKMLDELGNGIHIQISEMENIQVKGYMLAMSCDIPARSAVLNINQHNGESCCIKCLQTGVNHRTATGGNIRVFPYIIEDPSGPERTHDHLLTDAQEVISTKKSHINGVKGPSTIMFAPRFDSVKGVAIDYMHLVCLGTVRLLLRLWFDVSNSLQNFSLYRFVSIVDARLDKIKPPHYITRIPRTISEHLKFWKAAELRSWLFYYSVPCLMDLLPPNYMYHYAAFVEGIYLLCQTSVSPSDIEKSENLLRYFVFMFSSMYGERYMTINIHSALHLPNNVKELGPLWALSCFGFEGANGEILKLFHGTQFIDLQIVNAVQIFQLLPTLSDVVTDQSPAYKLVRSLLKKCDSTLSQFSFLGKPYDKILSMNLKIHTSQYFHGTILQLKFYKRAYIRGVIYQSKDYTRVSSRISYAVKYIDDEGFKFGFILWFAENNAAFSPVEKKIAYVERLDPSEINVFTRNVGEEFVDNHILKNFMDIGLSHVTFLKTGNNNIIVPIKNIIDLCVCIEIDGLIAFIEEPNHFEKNL